jgi:Arc/MetJ-type ribon-helix-helix transcriptional regulator
MRRQRITVTVPPTAVAAAEQDVAGGRASSVSAWVSEAMEEKARREKLKDLLEEIRAEIGPSTDEETQWARSVLGL